MREILFRGKRTDNNKWIEGNLVKFNGKTYIVPLEEKLICCAGKMAYMFYDVVPETVGQFTGTLDKNLEMIFEGDIVRVYHYSMMRDECLDYNGVVKYTASGFGVFHNRSVMLRTCLSWGYSNEIIGNIHDNPELLHIDDIKWH